MKINILFLIALSLVNVSLSQESWKHIYTFNTEQENVLFIDSLVGFSYGEALYNTTDGGTSWSKYNIDGLTDKIHCLIKLSEKSFFGVGKGGAIIKSLDGGLTWLVSNIGEQTELYSVCTSPDGTIFIASRVKVFKSTDNGKTWSVKNTDTIYLASIAFANQLQGYGVGWYDTFVKTTDSGETWSKMDVTTRRSLFKIIFISEDIGYISCGEYILKTNNSGENWRLVYSGNNQWNDITYAGSNLVWAAGSFEILRSTDGGDSWKGQTIEGEVFTSIYAYNDKICFASGSRVNGSTLFKCVNEGTANIDAFNNLPEDFNLFQNYPNPFNPTTTIEYSIPTLSSVTLKVYDILGREVTTLVNEEKLAGRYQVTFDGSNFSSGVYFYRIDLGDYSASRKLLLLK